MDYKKNKDWGEVSETFDDIKNIVKTKDLSLTNEAQTRFHIIDRIIREVLLWSYGQIEVEERDVGERIGFVDYILRANDCLIIIEAKKIGAVFPSPTARKQLKLTGQVIGTGEISEAIKQAETYAENKGANFIVVTNGLCWCCYPLGNNRDEIYATLFFPFSIDSDAERLFQLFNSANVDEGSLSSINGEKPLVPERRLIFEVRNSDARVDRNNIADYITPALNTALYAESILSNKEQLEKCFVTTQGRIKFDATLGIHLADSKSTNIVPARRIDTSKSASSLKKIVENSIPSFAPPVTLIIGQVGAGKSTYLKHFELVSGDKVLKDKKAYWIYIDFEAMGKGGDPRKFIYNELMKYLLADHEYNSTDYKSVIEPAYEEEIAGLARGPFAPMYISDKKEFNKLIIEYIKKDYDKVEPYIDKVYKYIAKNNLCMVVLDNIDLYEDEKLETLVFSEGVALSKRIYCNIIVSLRDRTFVKHRNDSAFDAYELKKLWLDPPPFKAVLSNRISYSKKILEKKSAQIISGNGIKINVPDLSVFFDIVQKSILSGKAGDFIDAIADNNIRKGLALVTNFLTSGHIQANRAIKSYLDGNHEYTFPFHEVFKGSILGQWKNYKEDKAECINLFDSRIGSKNARLLRLYIVKYLWTSAKSESNKEVPVSELVEIFTKIGISGKQIIDCLNDLSHNGLLKNIITEDIIIDSTIVITRRGGYYIKYLSKRLVYMESCMYDTAIDDDEDWETLLNYTISIEMETSIPKRMDIRKERILYFVDYLTGIEIKNMILMDGYDYIANMGEIKDAITLEINDAVRKAHYWHS